MQELVWEGAKMSEKEGYERKYSQIKGWKERKEIKNGNVRVMWYPQG